MIVAPEFPIFVLIFDEHSFVEKESERGLQHFEQPDIEEGPHRAWDARGREFRLVWDDRLGRVGVEFVQEQGASSFANAVKEYEDNLRTQSAGVAPRGRCAPDVLWRAYSLFE